MANIYSAVINGSIIKGATFTPIQPNPAVISLTVEGDQIVICEGGTQITATVVLEPGDDISKHTVQWVQTRGPSVISIVDGDTLSPIIQFPVTTGDISFRVYIDKGIPGKEKYDDIIVYRSPISKTGTTVGKQYKVQPYITSMPGTNSFRSEFQYTASPAVFDSNGNIIQSATEINYSSGSIMDINFKLPPQYRTAQEITDYQLSKFNFANIESWNGTSWVIEKRLDLTDVKLTAPPANKPLRLSLYYDGTNKGTLQLYTTNGANIQIPEQPSGTKLIQGISKAPTYLDTYTLSNTILRYTNKRYQISTNSAMNVDTSTLSTSITRYKNIKQNESSNLASNLDTALLAKTITRFKGISIG